MLGYVIIAFIFIIILLYFYYKWYSSVLTTMYLERYGLEESMLNDNIRPWWFNNKNNNNLYNNYDFVTVIKYD